MCAQHIPHLDARLSAAAGLARAGEAVADIGCDHGKLTAFLAASGLYPKVIGADLRPAPLARARRTLEAAGLAGRAELRLGDGLAVLAPHEAGTVIIAGVSAHTTIDILSAAPWVAAKGGPRLVLVPATKHSVLRAWLYTHGFILARDIPIRTAGRWYAIMAADYTGEAVLPAQLSAESCVYGKTGDEPGGSEYAALQRGKLRKFRLGLSDEDPSAAAIDALLAAAPSST